MPVSRKGFFKFLLSAALSPLAKHLPAKGPDALYFDYQSVRMIDPKGIFEVDTVTYPEWVFLKMLHNHHIKSSTSLLTNYRKYKEAIKKQHE